MERFLPNTRCSYSFPLCNVSGMVVFVDSSKLYIDVSCPNSVTRYIRTVVNGTEEADNPVDSDGELTVFWGFIHLFMVEL